MNKLEKIEKRIEEVEGRLDELFGSGIVYCTKRVLNCDIEWSQSIIGDYIDLDYLYNCFEEFIEYAQEDSLLNEEEIEKFEEECNNSENCFYFLKENYRKWIDRIDKKEFEESVMSSFLKPEDIEEGLIDNVEVDIIIEDYVDNTNLIRNKRIERYDNIHVFVKDENIEEWFNLIEELDDLKNDLSEEQESKPQPIKQKKRP